MKGLHVFHGLMAAALAALLPLTARAMGGPSMGGHTMGGHVGMAPHVSGGHRGMAPHIFGAPVGMMPHFSSGRGSGHEFRRFDHRHDFAFRNHDFDRFRNRDFDRDDRFRDRDFDRDDRFRDRDFDRDDRFFRHHDRFFFVFDFVSFGFPVAFPVGFTGWYPGYSYDSSYSGNGPVYDRQYWTELAVSVQSELAQRGYYHGAIDGEIGSGSRQAIRAFQAAQGLPVTGMIDPKLLTTLGIKYKTA